MASEGFFERVYEVVEQIPEGMVATYGQVALLAGRPRSARYVGYALHSNPRPGQIPCHRVVFADGRICEGFAFGGPDAQRELLLGGGRDVYRSHARRSGRLSLACRTLTVLPCPKPPQRCLYPSWWNAVIADISPDKTCQNKPVPFW